MELDYFVADVFTERALEGNPLAVVMNPAGLATEKMQAIAREFNLSETSFVERRPAAVERAEGVRVRIFTTREELNFAGHPTLGTASVLRMHAPDTVHESTVTLKVNVGPVPVQFSGEGLFGEMTQRDPTFGEELDAATVARLMGLELEDLNPRLPPQTVSTGTAFAIVVLGSEAPLARLKVNHDEANRWLEARGGAVVLCAGADRGARGRRGARGCSFTGGEDPATGSAAGCAISYLVARGAVAEGERIHVRQGVEMGRPSDLFLSARRESARVTDVRVGGSTVLVANGRLFLP